MKIEITDIKETLDEYAKAIENEESLSYMDLAWLGKHRQDVLEYGDIRLCEWAGITEEEYNNNKLEEEK